MTDELRCASCNQPILPDKECWDDGSPFCVPCADGVDADVAAAHQEQLDELTKENERLRQNLKEAMERSSSFAAQFQEQKTRADSAEILVQTINQITKIDLNRSDQK